MFIDIHSHRSGESGALIIRNDLSPVDATAQDAWCSVGIHPWNLRMNSESTLQQLVSDAVHPHVFALGECGIDTVHRPLTSLKDQTELFLCHANIAAAVGKPLILHCVRALDSILQLRKRFFLNAPPWIYHGFGGTPAEAEMLLRTGIVISVGPRLLESAKRDILKTYIDTGFFLESDDSGVPISEVYALACDILNISVSVLESRIVSHPLFDVIFSNVIAVRGQGMLSDLSNH